MHLDVTDLRAFYYQSRLGRAAQLVIRRELRGMWPDVRGQSVLGFGFAVPLLRPFLAEARRIIALMPGPQGVMPWPDGAANHSALCDETLWPVETGSADRLVLLHGLDTSVHPAALLEECYRVLGPGGRAVFIVPNRAGLWARRDITPFGYGRPYSAGQLEDQLRDHGLQVEQSRSTLFQPPFSGRMWRRSAGVIERAGQHIALFKAGGVLMVEVSKRVPRPARPDGLGERMRRPLRVLEGIAVPEPRPERPVRNAPKGWLGTPRRAGFNKPKRSGSEH